MTLEGLDGERWETPRSASHLVSECHRLRKVPLKEFTVENLRIMIGQALGLVYLIPLALEKLETDPLAQGDLFEGDLLLAVLRVEPTFWQMHPELFKRLSEVMLGVQKQTELINTEILSAWSAHCK